MGFFSNIKGVIYKLDFFYTAELLRYREEPQYRTLFGGVLSVSIILLLLVTFYNKVFDTFKKVIIQSSVSATSYDDPRAYTISTMPGQPFMFGVEIWHFDLNANPRYFDVNLIHGYLNTGEYNDNLTEEIHLEPCTKQHWSEYPSIVAQFDRLSINTWLCLPKNLELEISGKYASVVSRTLQIAIKRCTNSSFFQYPCAPDSQIDAIFANETNFYYTIYFINPLINADSQEFLSYYLQDSNYIMFSATDGEECQIMMEDYSVQTDQSIIPFSQNRIDEGGIVSKNCIKNRYTIDPSDPQPLYATFFIYKSPISKNISRSFQKIDEILSYIGGLFGTIAICLFFVNIYNGYSFEVLMGGYLFKPDDHQMGKQLKKYNFLYFLLHMIYVVAQTIGFQPKWTTTKLYYECREEMVKQLDILYLLRRVTILQRAMGSLLTDRQIRALHLLDNRTLAEAKADRRKFRWNQQSFIYKINHRKHQPGDSHQMFKDKNWEESPQKSDLDMGMSNSNNQEPNYITQTGNINKVGNNLTFQSKNTAPKSSRREMAEHESSLSSQSQSEEGDTQIMVREMGALKIDAGRDIASMRIWNRMTNNVKVVLDSAFDSGQFQRNQQFKNTNSIFDVLDDEVPQRAAKLERKPKMKRFKQLPNLAFPQGIIGIKEEQKEQEYDRKIQEMQMIRVNQRRSE